MMLWNVSHTKNMIDHKLAHQKWEPPQNNNDGIAHPFHWMDISRTVWCTRSTAPGLRQVHAIQDPARCWEENVVSSQVSMGASHAWCISCIQINYSFCQGVSIPQDRTLGWRYWYRQRDSLVVSVQQGDQWWDQSEARFNCPIPHMQELLIISWALLFASVQLNEL